MLYVFCMLTVAAPGFPVRQHAPAGRGRQEPGPHDGPRQRV